MDPRSQPLRDEHLALLPELGALRTAADAVGTAGAAEELARTHRLLIRHLVPHMAAEEAVLYPVIDAIVGTDLTAPMRLDHDEIRAQINRIIGTHGNDDNELRADLYGLDAIVRLHIAKEEELLYPLLDRHLDDQQANALVAELHQVARRRYGDLTGEP